MNDFRAEMQTLDYPCEVEGYLSADLPRQQFIAGGQAYLADLYRWLTESNVRLRGRQVIGRFTKAHDNLIEAAYAHAVREWDKSQGKATPPLCLVALGGYGRGELFLRSDVDLLFLMEKRNYVEDTDFVKYLLHVLIDLKLNLGYITRTISDCESIIGRDIDSATAMTEKRLIAGQKALYQRLSDVIGQAVRTRWRKWFLEAVYQQWQARHEKYESTVYLLEPNVKESSGGLRDVHSVMWVLFALCGSTDLKHLKEQAGFTEEELRRYREALAMLQTVRNEVHIAAGSKNDQLLFTFQPAVSQRLGYEAVAHRSAEEVFMADYFWHARTISHLSKRAIRTMLQQDKSILSELFGSFRRKQLDANLFAQDGVIFVNRDNFKYFEEDDTRFLALFERAVRGGYHLSDETLDHLSQSSPSLGPAFRLHPMNCARFMRILKAPTGAARAISDMHECGVLNKLLPEFERISCMVRIDYYHHYTVDEHSIKTLEISEKLRNEPADQRTFAGEIASEIKRWDLLNLALLLHDIGKGYGRGHALRGGQIAQRVGDRLGLPPGDVQTVRFLVLSHLKLTHVAQRRDLSDAQVTSQLAEEIGTLERLKLLYIHTVCDLKAVSPDAWTDWKGELLAECYVRTAELLGEKTLRRQQLAPNLQLLRQKVLSAIKEETEDKLPGKRGKEVLEIERELEIFLKTGTDRYIQSSTATTIARHFLIRRQLDERNAIDWRLQHDTGAGFSELTIAATDVPGLFGNICGALAAKDINIWSAQIFSTTDGFALDQFQVTDLENQPLPAGLRLDRLRHDLNQVILGEKTIDSLIEKHRGRTRIPRSPHSPLPTSVLFDNTSSQECTVIEIRTTDRPGLLYRITRALSQCQLDIQRSIITTEAYGVVDVFYVTDLEYNKIYDPAQRKIIEQEILSAIEV